MPIFKRFKIDRYKEVMINQSTGLIPDGGFSTYTFDNESNGDFVGIVKDIRLIGEVTEITLDSGRFSQNELNNTTQFEFDQLVSNRTIRITERTLGWVEITKTRASFYYEECSPTSFVRKRPVSEHYYDFLTFGFGTSLLAGSGLQDTDSQYSVGEAALRPVGTFDPNIGNNMGVFGPGFNQIDLQSYMRMVINSTISQGQGLIQNQQGEFRGVNGWSPLDGEILRQIPLYLVNKDEHFNNPNSETISSGKYGRNRDVILEGFRASSYINADFSKSIGVCLDTTILNTSASVNTTNVGGNLSTGLIFYVNDSSFTKDYGNETIKAVDEAILYNILDGPLDSNSPSYPKTPTVVSKYSYSENSIAAVKPLSDKYKDDNFPPKIPDPDIVQPPYGSPFEPRIIDKNFYSQNETTFQRPIDSLGIQATENSIIIIRTNQFRTIDDSPWKQKKSLNFNYDPVTSQTYSFYKQSDTPIYDTKKRIANFNSINSIPNDKSVAEYKERLIFIKNEIIKRRKEITG